MPRSNALWFILFLMNSQNSSSLYDSLSDSHGNIDHAHLPLWGLAIAGSSYIMLEKSTENLGYFMAQVKAVKQRVSKWKLHICLTGDSL